MGKRKEYADKGNQVSSQMTEKKNAGRQILYQSLKGCGHHSPLLACSDVTVIDRLCKETRIVANKAITTRFQDSEEKVLRN